MKLLELDYSGLPKKKAPLNIRVMVLFLYNKRQSSNHDISENYFEETFCVL